MILIGFFQVIRMLYKSLVGGVLSFRDKHFTKVNGYSNLYWGWGAEDDDMHKRLSLLKTSTTRYLKDGLNTLEYKLVETRLEKLWTRIIANVGDPPKNQTENPL
ncbi:BRE4-like protein [Mya arenaria]|uniref:BRE4-like protein n=1 Tax=Mya arenaria TaxID=6604 RepID=A0ABY7EEE3_MYAAR|nr:BRE4-like protein [Mya arenaria]